MQRIKVINVFTRMGAGGPPLQAVLLMRTLPAFGFDSILAAGRCEPGEFDMTYLLRGDEVVRSIPHLRRSINITDDIQALWHLYRLFRQERPAIVHTHTAKAGVLGRLAARLAGVPTVIHSFHGNVLSGYFSAPVNFAIKCLERFTALLTNRICVLSEQQRRDLVDTHRIAPARKVSILPLGLDLRDFQALPSPDPANEFVVAWLGRLVPIKNVPLLCDVILEATRRIPHVRFIIAGDGPERHIVEAIVRAVGERCEFVGWQQDVLPVLARAHILIQTSRNEGTPAALIQGLAAGRPFVSTPAGGVVDLVDGSFSTSGAPEWFHNAVLVPPRAEAFVEAIAQLSVNPGLLRDMSSSARAYAQNYSQDRLLSSIRDLYGEFAGSEAATPPKCAFAPGIGLTETVQPHQAGSDCQ